MSGVGDVLLQADGLTKAFGGLKAVDGVSLTVQRGEVFGIIGPNGAGKTTLFNCISGHLRASGGSLVFDGVDVSAMPAHQRARLGMGRTFQIVHPIHSISVLENVMIGAFASYRRRGAAEKRAVEILETVDLSHRADVLAGSLTLADRKRLEVARALAGRTKLLLLDEVMAGLNPVEASRAVEMIRRLHEQGVSVIVIEHNLKVVRALAQRVLVLDHGKPLVDGSPSEVLDDPRVVEAYLGRKKAS